MDNLSTKERILLSALDLFSQYGYEAVSVEQIANAVGIKAPSLYKHYRSKQAIFDAIFVEMNRRYKEQVASMHMHLKAADSDQQLFTEITEDGLVEMVLKLIRYSLRDEYVSKFRRMLTIEQFRNKEFAELYTQRYVDSMLEYHEQLFEQLVKNGTLMDRDTHILALQYVSPVYVLLGLCDREPEKEEQAMALLEQHIRQFYEIYGKRK